jgi:hypothetical protein
VLSEDVLELNVCKKEVGSVRDGYRPGFIMRAWDAVHAF